MRRDHEDGYDYAQEVEDAAYHREIGWDAGERYEAWLGEVGER